MVVPEAFSNICARQVVPSTVCFYNCLVCLKYASSSRMVHEAAATISTVTICLKPMPRAEVEVLWLTSKNMDGSVDGNARLPVFLQA